VAIAHFRLVCDINAASVAKGYDEVMARDPAYVLWGAMDFTTVEGRQAGLTAIDDYNRFIEAYCRDKGRVLIDLEPVLKPTGLEDLGRNFIDFIHPSPSAYDAMARRIEAALAPIVQDKSAPKLA
jgi:transposase InsO family protein